MHTFFINTSGKALENYADIFEIQHETRRLVSLECPLTDWNDGEKGYQACVRKMGELIDSYKDINNDFNLIIYIDLLAYEAYTSIPMDRHRERYACLKVLHSVLKHYIKYTFVNELDNCGRVPRETLLIFEENQSPKDGDGHTEDGKSRIRSHVKAVLGLPEVSELDKIVYNTVAGEVPASNEQLCENIANLSCSCLGTTVFHTYMDQIDTFVKETKNRETSAQPFEQLLDRIVGCCRKDDETVRSVSFITNRRAGIANKQEKTRRNLRLCFYILTCIEDGTIYDPASLDVESEPCVKVFPEIDWENVEIALRTRENAFKSKHQEVLKVSDSFSEMGLAPPLYPLYHERFALDQHGNRAKSFEVVDVEDVTDEEQKKKDAEQGILTAKGKKAVVATDVCGSSLFSEEEYPMFDYYGDSFDEGKLGPRSSPEQFVAAAKKLRQHHMDYLHRLKAHVSDRLSNYAGRSFENDPALLSKRKVSVAEEGFEDSGRDYRYARPAKEKDTRKLKTVENISKASFTSTLMDYLEFCAGRSVAVTDIEEQCNWFVTRIQQIQDSLKKLGLVALSLIFAILALYTPFVVIQWEAITENMMTVTVAILSVLIPIVLVYLIFSVLGMLQRKKGYQAWKDFKDISDRILHENAVAAEKYDRLLTVYIPTVRWVYEYKLDVEFYADCCKMARAKLAHHMQKLHDRVVTIGNIIEDLEADIPQKSEAANKQTVNPNDKIDYNVSFCSSDENRRFYSIIDRYFLESVHK